MVSKRKKCTYCNKKPKYIKNTDSKNKVYYALECKCKNTSFYSKKSLALLHWNTRIHQINPKNALAEVKYVISGNTVYED